MKSSHAQREIDRLERRRAELHQELKDFANVTRARRIRINIMLDAIVRKLTALRRDHYQPNKNA
jgi:hypothetical protein